MKRFIYFILGIILLFSPIYGQQVTAQADVFAEVQAILTLSKDLDVDFSGVQVESIPVLDPQGTANSNVGVNANAGQFTIGGTNGTQVSVGYTDATLEEIGGSQITFTSDMSWDASSGNQVTSTDIGTGSLITLGASGATLWLGGSLGDLTGQIPGSYATSIGSGSPVTVTVEYY